MGDGGQTYRAYATAIFPVGPPFNVGLWMVLFVSVIQAGGAHGDPKNFRGNSFKLASAIAFLISGIFRTSS